MKNNNNIIPMITYNNMAINKSKILIDNKGKSGVYRWNNLNTGKSYIGSSIDLGHRFSQYYSLAHLKKKEKSIIYRAILKHGYTKFSLDILEYCEASLCISREQYYLDLLKPEYNICKIAGSRLGTKQSEETKIKIGIVQKGMYNHFYGKMHTDETRKKMHFSLKSIIRDSNKSRVATIETRLKMSLRCKGINVKVYDKSNNFINEFPTITSVAKFFGLSNRTVGYYLDKDKSYSGYTFKSNISN